MPRQLERYRPGPGDQLQVQPIDNSRAAVTSQLAQALGQFSRRTAAIGGQMASDMGERQGAQEGASTRAPGRKAGYTAFGRAYNNAAERAHAAAIDQDVLINLERIALESPQNTAEFDAKVTGYRKGLLEAVDPAMRPAVAQELDLMTQRHRARVQAEERKLVLESSMGTLVEAASGIEGDTLRAARDGDLDIVEHQRAKLVELLSGATRSPENPEGILDPAEVAKRLAAFERQIDAELLVGDFERVLRTEGAAAAMAVMDRFEAGEIAELEPLVPEDRDRLLGRMNALLARQMTRENRDQAAADAAERARLAELKDRTDDAVRVLEAGFMPEDLEELISDSAGTEYESRARLAAAIAGQAQTFALMDPRSQEAALAALEGNMRDREVKPEEVQLLNTLSKIHANALTQLDQDALSYGQRQGLIDPLGELGVSNPESLAEGLADRRAAAVKLEAHYGRPVAAVTRQEASMLSDALAQGTASERMTLLSSLVDGLGTRAPSTLEALHKEGHETMAFAGGMLAEGNQAARDVLLGLDHLAADPGLKPKDLESRPELLGVRRAYPPGTQNGVVSAITAHYARLSAVAGDHSGEFNPRRWETSVNAVTGGIVQYNTTQQSVFPAPAMGMSSRDFRKWMDSLGPEEISSMGGVAGFSPERAIEEIRDRGRLVPIGRGRWLVSLTSPMDGSERFLWAENPPDPDAPEFVLVFE